MSSPLAEQVLRNISTLLRDEMAKTVELLTTERRKLDGLVNALLEKNKLNREEIAAIL